MRDAGLLVSFLFLATAVFLSGFAVGMIVAEGLLK